MKGLLIKDSLILLKRKQNLLMFFCLAIFLSFTTGGYFILGYLPFLFINLAISTISYDEIDNGYSFLFTLPITRSQYVLSKYILLALVDVISCLLAFASSIIVNLCTHQPINITEYVSAVFITCPVFMLIISLIIPLHFKFSAEKLRVVYMVVYGIILLFAFGANAIVEQMGIDVGAIIQNLSTANKGILITFVIFIFVAIIYLSYLCSLKIVNKKEF